MAGFYDYNQEEENFARQAGQNALREAKSERTISDAGKRYQGVWSNVDIEQSPEKMRKSLYKLKQRQRESLYAEKKGGTGFVAEAKEEAVRGDESFDAFRLYSQAGDFMKNASTPEEKAEAQHAMDVIGKAIDAYQSDSEADPIVADNMLKKVVYGVASSSLPMASAIGRELWEGALVDIGIGVVGMALPEAASSVAGALQTGRVARKVFKVGDRANDAYKAYKLVRGAKTVKNIAVGMHAMQQTFGKSAAGDSLKALTEEGVDYDLAYKFSDREGKMEGLIEGIMSPLALVQGGVGLAGLNGAKSLLRGIFKKASKAAMLKAMAGTVYAQQSEQVEEGLQGYSSSYFRSAAHEAQVMREYEKGLVENIDAAMADPNNKIKEHYQLVEDGVAQYKEAFWATLGFGIFGGAMQAPSTIADINKGKAIDKLDATQGERQQAIDVGAGDFNKELDDLRNSVYSRQGKEGLAKLYQEIGMDEETATRQAQAFENDAQNIEKAQGEVRAGLAKSKAAQSATDALKEEQAVAQAEAKAEEEAQIAAENEAVAEAQAKATASEEKLTELKKTDKLIPDEGMSKADFIKENDLTPEEYNSLIDDGTVVPIVVGKKTTIHQPIPVETDGEKVRVILGLETIDQKDARSKAKRIMGAKAYKELVGTKRSISAVQEALAKHFGMDMPTAEQIDEYESGISGTVAIGQHRRPARAFDNATIVFDEDTKTYSYSSQSAQKRLDEDLQIKMELAGTDKAKQKVIDDSQAELKANMERGTSRRGKNVTKSGYKKFEAYEVIKEDGVIKNDRGDEETAYIVRKQDGTEQRLPASQIVADDRLVPKGDSFLVKKVSNKGKIKTVGSLDTENRADETAVSTDELAGIRDAVTTIQGGVSDEVKREILSDYGVETIDGLIELGGADTADLKVVKAEEAETVAVEEPAAQEPQVEEPVGLDDNVKAIKAELLLEEESFDVQERLEEELGEEEFEKAYEAAKASIEQDKATQVEEQTNAAETPVESPEQAPEDKAVSPVKGMTKDQVDASVDAIIEAQRSGSVEIVQEGIKEIAGEDGLKVIQGLVGDKIAKEADTKIDDDTKFSTGFSKYQSLDAKKKAEIKKTIERMLGKSVTVSFVNRMFEQGADRLGKYRGALITLVEGAQAGDTALHEAIHAAEDMFLTEGEKARIEVLMPNAEDRADAFIEYMNTGKFNKLSVKLKRYFRKLANAVKGFFGVKAGEIKSIDQLYDMLQSGEIAERGEQAGPTAVTQFKTETKAQLKSRLTKEIKADLKAKAEARKAKAKEKAKAKKDAPKKKTIKQKQKDAKGEAGIKEGKEHGLDLDTDGSAKYGSGAVDTTEPLPTKLLNRTRRLTRAFGGFINQGDRSGVLGKKFQDVARQKIAMIKGGVNRSTRDFIQNMTVSKEISKKLGNKVELKFANREGQPLTVRFDEAGEMAMHIKEALLDDKVWVAEKGKSVSPIVKNLKNGWVITVNNKEHNFKLSTREEAVDMLRQINESDPDIIKEVERVSKVVNELYDKIAPIFKKLNQTTLSKREFYAHIIRDMSQHSGETKDNTDSRSAMAKTGFMKLMQGSRADVQAALKQMTGGTEAPMTLNGLYKISMFAGRQSIAYQHMAEYTRGMTEMIENDAFKRIVLDRYAGNKALQQSWLNQTGQHIESLGGTYANMDESSAWISKNLKRLEGQYAIAYLSSPFTAAKQAASIGNMATYFGFDTWAKGLTSSVSKEEMDKILAQSYGLIEARGDAGGLSNVLDDTGLKGTAVEVAGPQNALEHYAHFQQKYGMFLTGKVDKATVKRAIPMAKIKVDQTWTGDKGTDAYYQAIGREADTAVSSTQVSMHDVGRTQMQRNKNAFVSALTFMRGARSISGSAMISSIDQWHAAKDRLAVAQKEGKGVEEARAELEDSRKNILTQFIYHGIVQAGIVEGITKGRFLILGALGLMVAGGDDRSEEDKEKDSFKLIDTIVSMVNNIAGTAVPLGDTALTMIEANLGYDKAKWKSMNFAESLNPVIQALNNVNLASSSWKKAAEYEGILKEGKNKEGGRLSRAGARRMRKNKDAAYNRAMDKTLDELFKAVGAPWVRDVHAIKKQAYKRRNSGNAENKRRR